MNIRKISLLLSSLAMLVIAGQIIFIIAKGEAFCLNQGCKMVETLTTVSPVVINLAGLCYFLAVFLILRQVKADSLKSIELLLLAGLAAEGVLISFQLFITHVFCAYCLLIFSFIILLNILSGLRQTIKGGIIFLAVLLAFSSLKFASAARGHGDTSLNRGTFAVKTCSDPTKQLYLFFSSSCPHCKAVIQALESCNNCNFHFNPVDKIKSLDFAGLTLQPAYSPAINRTLLTTLGIQTIPVLIARNPDGYRVITGEKGIIDYVRQVCFDHPAPSSGDSTAGTTSTNGSTPFSSKDGECSFDVNCNDATSR